VKYQLEERRPPYNAEVASCLGFLLGRCANLGGTGTRPDPTAWADLVCDFGDTIPPWYHRLILDFPICGRVLGWQSEAPEDFYDGIEWLRWAHPRETYDCLCAHREDFIGRKKLFHIGTDPFEHKYYFIPSDIGDDPAIYKLDCRATLDTIEEVHLSLLVFSLSDFLRRAIVPPDTTIA